MPAKKIIDAVGSTLVVMGSSIATATAGPMPGSTPTAVPMMQPISDQSRLMGVAAVARPASSCCQMSMVLSSEPAGLREAGQADREQLGEHPVDRRRDGGADERVDDER